MVFILTGGSPTDEWESQVHELKRSNDFGNIVALGYWDADLDVLKQVTDHVLFMRDTTPESIKDFFEWVSDLVKQAAHHNEMLSTSGQEANPTDMIKIMPSPEGTMWA